MDPNDMIYRSLMIDWIQREMAEGINKVGHSGRYRDDVDLLQKSLSITRVNGKIIWEMTIIYTKS